MPDMDFKFNNNILLLLRYLVGMLILEIEICLL